MKSTRIAQLDRREWLRLAIPPTLGTVTSPFARAASAPGFGRAKSVLIVFAGGGQSQLDTYDPKPDAPEEVRGSFRSIATRTPGLRFCEHLPKLAARANRFAVIRSMTHDDVDHGSACYLALTGRFHPRKSSNPDAKPTTDFPNLGAVLQRVRPNTRLPHTAVQVNGPLLVPELSAIGLNAGFLGRGFDPHIVGDPRNLPNFHDDSLGVERIRGRQSLLSQLDERDADRQAIVDRGFQVLLSPAARTAFELQREPDSVRDRYGRHRAGQSCLLARRLVEAGVPWVTAFYSYSIRGQDTKPDDSDAYGWDTHNDIFDAMSQHLLPRFDSTLSVLLDDLQERGLLETTLLVVMGEFGRAPRVALEKNFVGTSPGRKHWAGCYSMWLAGAGITPGAVYGSSDRIAAYPGENPVTPGDITATLFHALGIDPHGHYDDPIGRPSIIATGEPLLALYR